MDKIVNIEVSIEGRRVDRDYVLKDGALPNSIELKIQDMVDTLLDNDVKL